MLIKDPPPGAPVPPILPPQGGFLFLDAAKFQAAFAAETKPSWYLVAKDDKMIPPPAQRAMSKRAGATVTEVGGSHAVYVLQPKAVAEFIKGAARAMAARVM